MLLKTIDNQCNFGEKMSNLEINIVLTDGWVIFRHSDDYIRLLYVFGRRAVEGYKFFH